MDSSAEPARFRGPLLIERAVGHTAAETLVRLMRADTSGFDTEQLAEHSLEVVRCTDRLRTVSARTMAYADAHAASLTKGAHTMSNLANTDCGLSRKQGTALNLVGTAPERYAHFYQALLEGRIGPGHIEVLHPVWQKVDKQQFKDCENQLVELAAACTPEKFADYLALWRNRIDEDSALDEYIRNQGRQHFQYGFDLNGNAHYSGTVGPELAEPFIDAIEHEALNHKADHIKPSQANGAAIAELVVNPTGEYQPTLEVLVPQDRGASARSDAEKATGSTMVPRHGDTGFGTVYWPRTGRGTKIPPAIADHLQARRARVNYRIVDRDGNIASDRPAGRRFTTVQKRLIRLRDNHCQHPGCRRSASRCEYDHVEPHEHDGPTLIRNGQLLCKFHHRYKHRNDSGPRRPTIFDRRPVMIQLE